MFLHMKLVDLAKQFPVVQRASWKWKNEKWINQEVGWNFECNHLPKQGTMTEQVVRGSGSDDRGWKWDIVTTLPDLVLTVLMVTG